MRKFKKLFLLTLLILPLLTACSESILGDMVISGNKFNHATIKLLDGNLIDGDIEKLERESNSDNLVVTFKDGKGTYFTHSSNIIIYNK
jgi:lipoprotein